MALTATTLRTSPAPSSTLYTSNIRSRLDDYSATLTRSPLPKKPELDLSALAADLMASRTPPLSSASSSSDSSVRTPPNTVMAKRLSKEILFGTGLPSSTLTGLSTAGVRHKRTLSFSATLLHRPSIASVSSFDGEIREEEFHASFPLPPGVELDTDRFSYGHMRRSSLPGSDTASIMAHLEETSKFLDEVLPHTPPPLPRSPVDFNGWPSPPERFRSRRSVYPESCHSISSTPPSPRPSQDDSNMKSIGRDTVMSLPFVWSDGSPIKRQPTNASTWRHALKQTSLKREKSAYAPWPESPKAFSPTASETDFPFSELDLNAGWPSLPGNSPKAIRRRGRTSKRSSGKVLSISTKLDFESHPIKPEIETILEADPQADEQPSPVPSSICLPDSLWPSPVIAPTQLPVEDMTPLQLDGALESSQKDQCTSSVDGLDLEEVLREMDLIMRAAEELDRRHPRTPTPVKASAKIVAPVPKSFLDFGEPSSDVEHARASPKGTEPLRVNKTLPQTPRISPAPRTPSPVKADTVKHSAKGSKNASIDLWRTMVLPEASPLQLKQEKTKETEILRSTQASPLPTFSIRRTPSPKQSPPHLMRALSPSNASPAPSFRSASPMKSPPPARPVRSPSPGLLDGIEFGSFDLKTAPSATHLDQFATQLEPRPATRRARRDSIDALLEDVEKRSMDQTSLLRAPFAQQIPTKAAKKLGVPQEAVMVMHRSPSRSSNFSDHDLPMSPAKQRKNPFGSLFASPNRKEPKTKADISPPLAGPIDPVVLYTPSVKSPTMHSIRQEPTPDEHGAFPWLAPHSASRPMSPAMSRSRSPQGPARPASRRAESINQRWI